MTLQERLWAIVSEQGSNGPVADATAAVPAGEATLTGWERDVLGWGFVYGAAFALARTDDPFAGEAAIVARAGDAAAAVFARWGEFGPRPWALAAIGEDAA